MVYFYCKVGFFSVSSFQVPKAFSYFCRLPSSHNRSSSRFPSFFNRRISQCYCYSCVRNGHRQTNSSFLYNGLSNFLSSLKFSQILKPFRIRLFIDQYMHILLLWLLLSYPYSQSFFQPLSQ